MRAIVSHAAYAVLRRMRSHWRNPVNEWSDLSLQTFGMPIEASSQFPHQFSCVTCEGTGEGQDSTYCRSCKGAGEIRTVGVMFDGPQTVMITTRLPRKFAPRFPAVGLPVPPLCRGLI